MFHGSATRQETARDKEVLLLQRMALFRDPQQVGNPRQASRRICHEQFCMLTNRLSTCLHQDPDAWGISRTPRGMLWGPHLPTNPWKHRKQDGTDFALAGQGKPESTQHDNLGQCNAVVNGNQSTLQQEDAKFQPEILSSPSAHLPKLCFPTVKHSTRPVEDHTKSYGVRPDQPEMEQAVEVSQARRLGGMAAGESDSNPFSPLRSIGTQLSEPGTPTLPPPGGSISRHIEALRMQEILDNEDEDKLQRQAAGSWRTPSAGGRVGPEGTPAYSQRAGRQDTALREEAVVGFRNMGQSNPMVSDSVLLQRR